MFTRFGWHDATASPGGDHLPPGWIDQPYMLTKRGVSAQQIATITYFLVTIVLVVATWLRFGWIGAIGTFAAASLTFGRFRAASLS